MSSISPGKRIFVQADGGEQTYPADITYISPQAEYTPPVIYSRETRSKLVYMVEAELGEEDADDLHPGQPVDVSLETPDA